MKAERGAVRAGLLGLLLAAMCRCSGGWLMIDDAGSTEAGFRFDDGSQHGDLGPSVDACAMQCGGVRVEPIAGTCTYPIPCELGGGATIGATRSTSVTWVCRRPRPPQTAGAIQTPTRPPYASTARSAR